MVLQKIIHKLVLLFAFYSTNCFANKQYDNNDSTLLKIISKGINYLSANQIKEQNGTDSYIGEWPTFIYNTQNIPFLGKKGKSAYDSNVFNTLFVHNALVDLYFNSGRNEQIIPTLVLAQKNLVYFKNENSFNFWPELPRPKHLKCKDINCTQRRANNFDYHYSFINNYANIFDDADDTSTGYLAYYYNNMVKDSSKSTSLTYFPQEPYTKNLERYRDTGNRKTNWYNKKLGFNYRTGAYLTWFGDDRKPSHFFTWFFPYHKKQNILYGRNEVDCVVNANILRTLFIIGDTTIAGVKEAKEFLKNVIKKKVCFTCGVYYPTEFSFHYALAKAMSSGVKGFDDVRNDLIKEILETKNTSGHWTSVIDGNDLQSTLYAVNALMNLSKDEKIISEIEKAVIFILSNMINENEMVHWKGGVFFSGGSAIRYEHVWVSDAYTTCLALEAITNYLKIKKAI
jgi:hypothetical protein